MHTKNILIVLFLFVSIQFYGNNREVQILQTGWKFQKGENQLAHQNEFDDSEWEELRLPHDWAVDGSFMEDGDGNTGKLPWKGQGWYRTTINLNESQKDQQIYLLFDGVMAFPKVYINGELAGQWDYGYNSFYLNITELIDYNAPNTLAVHVDTRKHDSRWYPGAGIYRKVSLISVDPVHVGIWGTYITTPVLKPHFADVDIATTVNNFSGSDQEIQVNHAIYNINYDKIGEARGKGKIKSGKNAIIDAGLTITNPRLWDINDPHLYKVKTVVEINGEVVDNYESKFGVRDMRFTADHGFYLNNRRVQMKGVNLHHDNGPLGAVFNRRAMERKLQIMKDMGCNAIRNSHNVDAPELAKLCDSMGLLLFNEAFDKYDRKADILDTTDFDDFAHRNMRNFVVRDRNHPSVFLWSVGNEMQDQQWDRNNGFHKLRTMINYLEKYDVTRPNTMVCDSWNSARMRHFDYYDVHSWNYDRRYWLARQMEPNKSVIISESASTVSTRGFYEFPLPEEKTDFTTSLQISSYDLNAPYWAEIADDDFMWQQDEPYIAGEFVWTGFDYLGEPTPYNNQWVKEHGMTDEDASRSSYFGIVDLCGIPKDRFYLYKSYWKPEETTVHILPHWNWPERKGEKTPVFVYTNGDCAELFLNGESLGKQCKNPKSDESVDRFRLMWKDVIYEPGALKAVAYKEGKKIGEQTLKTTGEPHQLRLTPDRTEIKADGSDLSYILIEALDKDGNPHPLAGHEIKIEIEGDAMIAGVGNGNPQSFEPFKSNKVKLFYGKAMLIVQSNFSKGDVGISVEADNLKATKTEINIK